MKRFNILSGVILLALALMIGIAMTGCGSSSKAMKADTQANDGEDIDALLGLTGDAPAKTSAQKEEETIGEDDVLKLLGVEQGAQQTTKKPVDERNSNLAGNTLDNRVAVQENDAAAAVTKEANAAQPPPGRSTVLPRSTLSPNAPFANRYEEAKKLYDARNFRLAIQEFEILLGENMNHSLSDNCQYWIGESYWGLGNYQQAIAAFEKVFTFNKSNKDVDSQLKLGLCYMRLNDKVRAREELQKVIDNYPSSDRVTAARRYLAQLEGN